MTRIDLSFEAERDLIDIYLYGAARYGPVKAEQYAEALNARIAFAAENPSFGVDYGFVREGVRRYESAAHAIYYRRIEGGIRVLRILHGRMDPGRRLG